MMRLIRIVAFPLTFLYAIYILIKNSLYHTRILKPYRSNKKVISIGNISTGGSGKTPVVIALTEFILKRNKKVCVISRGYKRKTTDTMVIFPSDNIPSINETGDEMQMMIQRFRNFKNSFFAIVSENKLNTLKYSETLDVDIIILDDSFQNRKIFRELDVVIINKEKSNIFDHILIPTGNLREFHNNIKRCDYILNNYKFKSESSKSNNISYKLQGFINDNKEILNITDKNKIVIISAIADNESFLNIVSKLYKNELAGIFNYNDHHNYTKSDIEDFIKNFKNDYLYLTTEKDFVKLQMYEEFVSKYPVYYSVINLVYDENYFEQMLKNKNII